MNKDILKGKWIRVKGDIRIWWGKLTDDDVNQIEGDTENSSASCKGATVTAANKPKGN